MSGRTGGKRQAVTISDVAATAGVNKSMVSYALNNRLAGNGHALLTLPRARRGDHE